MTTIDSPRPFTQVLVVGGGLGGVAAALGAARHGAQVVLTEEFDWLGGQSTSQAVPPDEHPWIEEFGCTRSYRRFRDGIRDHYRRNYPLTDAARAKSDLNPGAGWVSKLCHEPKVAVAVIDAMLDPYRSSGALQVVTRAIPIACDVDGDTVSAVTFRSTRDGGTFTIEAEYVIDATELGDLLPLTGAEYVTGFESQHDTGEPSAPSCAEPDNIQALSICFAVDHVDGDHTIDKPARYEHWRSVQPDFWGAPLVSWTAPHPRTLDPVERSFQPNPDDDALSVFADQSLDPGDGNLWTFRRIAARSLFTPGSYESDITLVNWPSIDYFEAPVIDVETDVAARRLEDAAQLSLSMLYWMQTEAPRPDGGVGWRGLRLRPDVMGTADGLAMAPYHRESRRIRGLTTVREQDISYAVRGKHGAARFDDTVGVGMYRIDLHPSTGGDNYIDVPCSPFELPAGALIPRRMRNLLAGGKNIATTHVTNGAYRLHPIEWNAGEVAGILAAECLAQSTTPHQVHSSPRRLEDFQRMLIDDGVELRWPGSAHPY